MDEWHGDELKIPQCFKGKEKGNIMGMDREATIILTHPSPVIHFIAVSADWFELYIVNDLGLIHDCYIAEILQNWTEVKMLGRYIPVGSVLFLNITKGRIVRQICPSCILMLSFLLGTMYLLSVTGFL